LEYIIHKTKSIGIVIDSIGW